MRWASGHRRRTHQLVSLLIKRDLTSHQPAIAGRRGVPYPGAGLMTDIQCPHDRIPRVRAGMKRFRFNR